MKDLGAILRTAKEKNEWGVNRYLQLLPCFGVYPTHLSRNDRCGQGSCMGTFASGRPAQVNFLTKEASNFLLASLHAEKR